ncbi:unnamed protein product [Agarophyton chilense]
MEPNTDMIQPVSRSAFMTFLDTVHIAVVFKSVESASEYEAIKRRRYLRFEYIVVGNGETVEEGTLVVARWVTILDNGSTMDDINESRPAMFRPGAHQEPLGVEEAVIVMCVGGVRRVYRTADQILTEQNHHAG